MSASPTAAEVKAGQAVYTPLTLALYDAFVLGFSCRFAWRCPRARMLAFYNRNVGATSTSAWEPASSSTAASGRRRSRS